MEKQKNTPLLRFPEFNENWEIISLGNYIKINSGISPNAYQLSDSGRHPFIKVEELNNCEKYQKESRFYTNETKNLIEVESIIFPKRGAAILNNKVRINKVPLLMDSNLMAIKPINESLISEFLYYTICKEKLYKIADTSTIPQINNKHIEPYKLNVPKAIEQQKIASFLTAVDDKLQALKKKKELLEQYKKGVMQKIFSQELRFKDEYGKDFPEWENKKLGQIFTEINEAIGTRNIETYSISAGKGFISQKVKFGKDISGQQNEKYIVVNPEEFSYNKGNSKTYTYGCIYLNNTGKTIAVPNVFISFKLTDSRMNSNYFAKLFEHHYLDKGLRRIISSTARMDGLLNVNKKYFFDLKVPVPSANEQFKIGDFLSAIDEKINHCQKQIEKTEQWKKGLLQKMFV